MIRDGPGFAQQGSTWTSCWAAQGVSRRAIFALVIIGVVVVCAGFGGHFDVRIRGNKERAEVSPVIGAEYIHERSIPVYDHVTFTCKKVFVLRGSKVSRFNGVRFVHFPLRKWNDYLYRRIREQDASSGFGSYSAIVLEIGGLPVNLIIHNKFGMNDSSSSLANIVHTDSQGNWDASNRGFVFRKLNTRAESSEANPSSLVGSHLSKLFPKDEAREHGYYDTRESQYRHDSFESRQTPPFWFEWFQFCFGFCWRPLGCSCCIT
jgi:hypothetical protein